MGSFSIFRYHQGFLFYKYSRIISKSFAMFVSCQIDSVGRGKHLRLFPFLALDQEVNSIKVEEVKNCQTFTTGRIRQGSTTCLCVAMKRNVVIYEFNRTKTRHKKIKELILPAPAQFMEVFGGRLCVWVYVRVWLVQHTRRWKLCAT